MAALHATDRNTIYIMLVQFPVVCFTLALLTDIVYWQTSHLMWTEFSAWLLFVGIVTGCLALVFGIIANLVRRDNNALHIGWAHLGSLLAVLILAFFNNLVHARDGWTSVVPWGLTLSALMVLVIFATPLVTTTFDDLERRRMPL